MVVSVYKWDADVATVSTAASVEHSIVQQRGTFVFHSISSLVRIHGREFGHACSHARVPRAHQAGSSSRSLAGVRLSESVRCHELGLALLTNGGV
ncbi:hypothetical protein TNCV_4751391 [Trichonephila clavipes]|nr:hypothetical protein TNCV_4751391 [Trichonephila clavipes]